MAVVAYNSGLDIERMFAVAQNLTFDTNNEGNYYLCRYKNPLIPLILRRQTYFPGCQNFYNAIGPYIRFTRVLFG